MLTLTFSVGCGALPGATAHRLDDAGRTRRASQRAHPCHAREQSGRHRGRCGQEHWRNPRVERQRRMHHGRQVRARLGGCRQRARTGSRCGVLHLGCQTGQRRHVARSGLRRLTARVRRCRAVRCQSGCLQNAARCGQVGHGGHHQSGRYRARRWRSCGQERHGPSAARSSVRAGVAPCPRQWQQ